MSDQLAKLAFQICPIILTGGTAGQIPGGMLPFTLLFNIGVINTLGLPLSLTDLDQSFGHFNVLPGGTLVHQSIAKYPFANQYVAANAVIREPLTLSVIMDAPMRGPIGGYFVGNAWHQKHVIMTALKATLDKHNNSGGTYTIMTPAYMYENMVMVSLSDNSRGGNSLPQNAWRFDFEKPLVALTELQTVQNQLVQKLTNGLPTTGNLSGIQPGLQSGESPLDPSSPPLPDNRPSGLITSGGTPTDLSAIVPGGSQSIFGLS